MGRSQQTSPALLLSKSNRPLSSSLPPPPKTGWFGHALSAIRVSIDLIVDLRRLLIHQIGLGAAKWPHGLHERRLLAL